MVVPVLVDQRLHKQLDHTYGSTGAISAFVTSASTGTNAGIASSTGSRYTTDYAIAGAGIGYAATGVGSLCAAFGSVWLDNMKLV